MISKERLEQLAEQGTKIYNLSGGDIYEIDLSENKINKFFDDGFTYRVKCSFGRNGKLLIFSKYKDVFESTLQIGESNDKN